MGPAVPRTRGAWGVGGGHADRGTRCAGLGEAAPAPARPAQFRATRRRPQRWAGALPGTEEAAANSHAQYGRTVAEQRRVRSAPHSRDRQILQRLK